MRMALKGNQPTLHSDVATFLDDPETEGLISHTTVDADHGRVETRTCTISHDIQWLQDDHQWPGLAAVGKVVRIREPKSNDGADHKATAETAYYLFSKPYSAQRGAEIVRSHWGIENALHWVLDVSMQEDQARNRKDNGPHNLAILRHLALNLLRKDKTKGSIRSKFHRAAWQDTYLLSLLALF